MPFDSWVYDSRQVSRLRQFATSDRIQILVINIDAFNKKDNNVIHQDNDRLSGRRPSSSSRRPSPIVIVDEPQNMESEPRPRGDRASTRSAPCATRPPTATPTTCSTASTRSRLRLRLVKRIEVDSVLDGPDFNHPYIHVQSINATARGKITAKLNSTWRDGRRAETQDHFNVSSGGGTDLLRHVG